MPLVFGAIAPHGGLAVAEWCDPAELELAAATRAGFTALGDRFEAAKPEVTVVATPHHVHVDGAFAVTLAGALAGALEESYTPVELTVPVDLDFALEVLAAILGADLPVVGVSFGGHTPDEATMPMDWGTLIPLWYLGGRAEPPVPVVVVSPCRDRPLREHVAAGKAIGEAAAATHRRVAFVASADHGHAHDPTGPYGFDPASAELDELVVDAVRDNRLDRIVELDADFVERAKADSPWQLAMLHGAIGAGARSELLSYEAPTYFGMLCAAYSLASR